jgi:hypothetical protein
LKYRARVPPTTSTPKRTCVEHTATINGSGRDTGGRGNASALINAKAESLSPTSTRVAVTTDLHITGKVAQFGRGIMGDVSAKLMAQFADNLNQMIDEQGLGATSAEPAATATASSEPGEAPASAAAPVKRTIDGPANDPIDLMEIGGSSIAKRAVPALIAIVVVLFLVRRLRR